MAVSWQRKRIARLRKRNKTGKRCECAMQSVTPLIDIYETANSKIESSPHGSEKGAFDGDSHQGFVGQ